MTNREKYAEQILKIACKGESIAVIKETNKMVPCNEAKCNECLFRECVGCDDAIIQWCNSEYVGPSVDWSKVPVDAPVLVRNKENGVWLKRHFAGLKRGKVHTWCFGRTSWNQRTTDKWKYAKLPEESNE